VSVDVVCTCTGNRIGNDGAISIGKALKINGSVTVLALDGNNIDTKIVLSIDNALQVNKARE
jgi:hypothetical protein